MTKTYWPFHLDRIKFIKTLKWETVHNLPFMYLVAEYMQISAPKAKGRCVWRNTQVNHSVTYFHINFNLYVENN